MHVHYPILYTYGLCLCIILSLPGPLSRPAPLSFINIMHTLCSYNIVSAKQGKLFISNPGSVFREKEKEIQIEREKES